MGGRRSASRRLLQDGDLLTEIEETRHLLQMAKAAEKFNPQGLSSELPRLERKLAELTERAAEEAVLFVVRAIPADDFDGIARNHPPTAEMMERWREQAKVNPWASMPEFNDATMGPDLLIACLEEPSWPPERIREWWADASKGERNQLWNLALSVQVQGADIPFSEAAIGMTDDGGNGSTTPPPMGSHSPSS